MGYRIDYTPQQNHRYPPKAKKPSPKLWLLAIPLIGLILTRIPSCREYLRQLLIPGDADVTRQAFSLFLEDIQGGASIKQSLQAFCYEIYIHGKIY